LFPSILSAEEYPDVFMFTLSSRGLVTLVTAFVRDERGDDLIEYALLAGLIGLAGVLAFNTISVKMSNAYTGWNANAQNRWVPDAPLPTP
jgi:pilus assembly protein Flp/PilA